MLTRNACYRRLDVLQSVPRQFARELILDLDGHTKILIDKTENSTLGDVGHVSQPTLNPAFIELVLPSALE